MIDLWGSKLLTPDSVRAPGLSLRYGKSLPVTVPRDTIQTFGWPLVRAVQGKVLLFLVTGQVAYNSGYHYGLLNRTSFIALPEE